MRPRVSTRQSLEDDFGVLVPPDEPDDPEPDDDELEESEELLLLLVLALLDELESELLEDELVSEELPGGVVADDPRLSVLKKPEPLKVTPTG